MDGLRKAKWVDHALRRRYPNCRPTIDLEDLQNVPTTGLVDELDTDDECDLADEHEEDTILNGLELQEWSDDEDAD